jgi:hypothetical protein
MPSETTGYEVRCCTFVLTVTIELKRTTNAEKEALRPIAVGHGLRHFAGCGYVRFSVRHGKAVEWEMVEGDEVPGGWMVVETGQ